MIEKTDDPVGDERGELWLALAENTKRRNKVDIAKACAIVAGASSSRIGEIEAEQRDAFAELIRAC